MANRQTRSLLKQGKSLHFNQGVNFMHLSGIERARHPEFTIVERPLFRGTECITAFGAKGFAGKRKHAYSAPTIAERKPKAKKKR